jgi:hypothetical protein
MNRVDFKSEISVMKVIFKSPIYYISQTNYFRVDVKYHPLMTTFADLLKKGFECLIH